MKKQKLLLPAALALAAAVCICFLTFGNVTIGRIEERTDGQWSQIHAYMNGRQIVEFPVSEPGQECVFQWETGRGVASAMIVNADGEALFITRCGNKGTEVLPADSDLRLILEAKGHGGVFSLVLRDAPEQTNGEPEPYLMADGTHTGSTFTESFTCRRSDGKYLNFYVENHGTEDVVITINGEYDKTIPPDSAGHTRAKIDATVLDQEMTVKCKTKGSDLDIYWKVAQRDG